ncbi:MAG TPA: VTT domain-containing protein [Symbiobacteriaceae bacterium]
MVLSKSGLAGMLSGFLEGIGVPWPGAVVLAAAGTGAGALAAAVLLGTLFALTYTAGSAAQYLIGRYCRDLLDRLLSPKTRDKLDRVIEKYGQAAVLWTRPFAIGNYVSLPAGIMRMPPGKFLVYTFLGIWPWAVGMTAAGSWISAQFQAVAAGLPLLAALLAGVGAIAGVWKLWQSRHASSSFSD